MNVLWSQHRSLIWRQRRLFSVRLLFLSLVLAVTSVVTILSVTDLLKASLQGASSNFLAGDRQLRSPREVEGAWLEKARDLGLRTAVSVQFSTMIQAVSREGESSFHLVSVKAVDGEYPLKGELEVLDHDQRPVGVRMPSTESAWLQKRLISLLNVEPGGYVGIGEHQLKLEGILISEPDAGFQLAGLAPRVMMRLDELAETKVIQPGSRVRWQYYFAGNEEQLFLYEEWLKPQLLNSQKWQGIREGRPAISEALDKADNYLLLGGSLAVLLAALAIAIATRQFVSEQSQMVAIVKAMGGRADRIFWQYCSELIALALFAYLSGAVLGLAISNGWFAIMQGQSEYIQEGGAFAISMSALMMGLATALLMMVSFAVPQLKHLRDTPSMRVLRNEDEGGQRNLLFNTLLAFPGVGALLYLYAQDWMLILALVGVMVMILATMGLLSHVGLRYFVVPWSQRMQLGSPLRMALQNIMRHRLQTLMLLSIFAVAIYLFTTLFLVRTSLLDQWQSQLPEDAPNHFLINVAPYDLDRVQSALGESGVSYSGLYPMVRGRLSHINDQDVRVAVTKDVGALNRELNLTWAEALPEDNVLESGAWWPSLPAASGAYVSIESELAARLEVGVGDRLRFSIGGRNLNAEISSVRKVQWDSMRPNFYMIFPTEVLSGFPATYITSFYIAPEQKEFLNTLAENFPTISILELDQLITKIRSIVDQVSRMIELLLAFIFVAALLVLAALVATTRNQRVTESVLLRTLGGERRVIYRIQLWEFTMLGLLAGIVAVLGAELSVYFIKLRLFAQSAIDLQYAAWFLVPAFSAVALASFGYLQTRSIPNVSPAQILREA